MVCWMRSFVSVAVCWYGGVPGYKKCDPQEAEFIQTNGNPELIDVSLDIESKITLFDSLENKFESSLTVNEDLILGNMEHMINSDKNHSYLRNKYLSTLNLVIIKFIKKIMMENVQEQFLFVCEKVFCFVCLLFLNNRQHIPPMFWVDKNGVCNNEKK